MRNLVPVLFVVAAACGEEPASSPPDAGFEPAPDAAEYELAGVVQKGPFINGSIVTVVELDTAMVPTGRTFQATIEDDTGAFAIPGVALAAPFVRLIADGFYFDEVRGALSAAPIVLTGLADVTDTATVNVNLLSHLARPRTEALIAGGASFADAKTQAEQEVLAVFEHDAPLPAAETLDIAGAGEGDAVLLAMSVLLQGWRTPAELTQLLSAFNTDLRGDGTLDDAGTGGALVNAAVLVDLAQVRANIVARYDSLGAPVDPGDFEGHIQAFLDGTDFEQTSFIEYPADGWNVLDPAMTATTAGGKALTAVLPRGTRVRVVISQASGNAIWSYPQGVTGAWTVGGFSVGGQSFEASALVDPLTATMSLILNGSGSLLLEIYENAATEPITKTLTF